MKELTKTNYFQTLIEQGVIANKNLLNMNITFANLASSIRNAFKGSSLKQFNQEMTKSKQEIDPIIMLLDELRKELKACGKTDMSKSVEQFEQKLKDSKSTAEELTNSINRNLNGKYTQETSNYFDKMLFKGEQNETFSMLQELQKELRSCGDIDTAKSVKEFEIQLRKTVSTSKEQIDKIKDRLNTLFSKEDSLKFSKSLEPKKAEITIDTVINQLQALQRQYSSIGDSSSSKAISEYLKQLRTDTIDFEGQLQSLKTNMAICLGTEEIKKLENAFRKAREPLTATELITEKLKTLEKELRACGETAKANKIKEYMQDNYKETSNLDYMMKTLRVDIEKTFGIDEVKKFDKALKDVNNTTKVTKKSNFANNLKTVLGIGGAVTAIRDSARFLKEANDETVNYGETVNLFNVSMGKGLEGLNQYYEKAVKFQNDLQEKLGANIAESMNYQALFNSMSKSMGISAKYAYILSENFTKLGYDLASLYNINPENAMQKLRAGLAGQTKPLRDLGLDITQQSLQPIVDSLGIDRSIKNMSQAEKMILRYIAVLNQAKIAQGDFANTMNSPANQLRIFNAQVVAFKRNMGNLWQGFLGGILPYVNAIMMVINELLKMVAKLFGFEVSEQKVNISANIGADDLASDLGTAGKKAKELKAQLMGFDEINNISLQDNSGSGGSEGGAKGTGIDQRLLDAMKEYDNLMDKVKNKATEIRDNILDWLGFTRDVNGNLKWSWSDMNGIAKTLAVITGIVGGIYVIGKITKLVMWIKNLKDILISGKGATTTFGLGIQTIGKFINGVKGGFSNLTSWVSMVVGQYKIFRSQGNGVISSLKLTNSSLKETGQGLSSFVSKGVGVVAGLAGITAGSALTYATMKDFTTGAIDSSEAVVKLTAGLSGATLAGAAAGSQFGTVGTIIGGVAGLTTSAVTAFMGYKDGIESLNIPTTTLTEEINSLTQEVDSNRQAHENAVKSIKDTYESQIVEAQYAENLSKQLMGLVDSNGKVKEGNEERVKFILGEMNNALGTEYKLNGNLITKNGEVVTSYKDLQKSIKETIEAKKKEAEQTAITELYKEDLKEQIKLERDKARLQEEYAKAEIEYNNLMAKGLSDWTLTHDENYKQIIENYTNIANELNETRDASLEMANNVEKDLKRLTNSQIENTGILSQEMINQQQVSSETLQNMVSSNTQAWEENYNNMDNATKSTMLAQSTTIDNWSPKIEQKWKEMASNSADNFLNGISQVEPDTQAKILATVTTTQNMTPQMATAWSNLANKSFMDFTSALSKVEPSTQDEILKSITTTKGLTGTTAQVWAVLASTSKERYNSALSSLDEDTAKKVQSAVDRINAKQWEANRAGEGLADEVERGVNTLDTTEAGKQAVNGVAEGINKNKNNRNLWDSLKGLKDTVVNGIKGLLGIHSPSRIMRDLVGKFIPLGIAEGIEAKSGTVYASIKKLNEGIKINARDFVIDTNQFIDYGQISGTISTQSKISVDNSMIERMGQACYNAFVNAMRTQGIKADVKIKPDKDGIFKVVQTEAEEYAMQTGESPFPVMA